ncbi:cytidylyltransferase domain-containing protein [Syntrophomonas wolfei]|jgi:spore coat polysaccharide biosynthesis protein SpsF|uniref:cytidylyltransferase domain-containing protein n=1 Tax=Syntrophomonas wolfei TaxID=863 RepID=UPI0007747BDE|nr:glycosyltransferase family protein [Syntrophomonas wolfei]
MKIVVIVQARMTSTRLPGKVLCEVMGKPLLEYQIERLRQVTQADELIIATTTNDTDQPIIELCKRLGVAYYRGPEEDVLSRYYEAAAQFGADVVVRVTSDCPLIDPGVMDEVISLYINNYEKYDYVSNTLERTYPRGLDTEVFSMAALEKACREAREKPEREHVTLFMYRRPEQFRLANSSNAIDYSQHRWTLDTPEDFQFIKLILQELYPLNSRFSWMELIGLLNEHPEWVQINAAVKQKEL